MKGKSAAFILRQMHLDAMETSQRFEEEVELPLEMSCLSLNKNSVPYFVQKMKEGEENLRKGKKRKA